MTDKKTKSDRLTDILIVISVAVFLWAIGVGIYGLNNSYEESREAEKIAEIESKERSERRLAAVADELGLETKYVLFDGRDTWNYEQHIYKTDRKEYIVVFDEKDQIQTIIEEQEED